MTSKTRLTLTLESGASKLETSINLQSEENIKALANDLDNIVTLIKYQDPYHCFLNVVRKHIEQAKTHSGGQAKLSVVKVENFLALCEKKGINQASLLIEDMVVGLSANIDTPHNVIRISETKTAILFEEHYTGDINLLLSKALANIAEEIKCSHKEVSYPEDGTTPNELIFLAYI